MLALAKKEETSGEGQDDHETVHAHATGYVHPARERALVSSGRQDEILRLAREAAGDEATFMQGLLALARRDVQEVLDQIRALDEPGSRTIAYEELAVLGRRLAAAAALIAGEEAT